MDEIQTLEGEEKIEKVMYVVTDIDNPLSALNLTDKIPTIHEAIKRVIVEAPDLLALDEGTFRAEFKNTVTANRIRMAFWAEYEYAINAGRKMFLQRIIGGLCSEGYFRDKFLEDNRKVAFMLCPPSDYLIQTKEALMAGLETVREIVTAKVVDEDGILIPRAADVVLKAVMHLDMRVKGAIIQRIDQRTLAMNINQNQNIPAGTSIAAPRTVEELDAQLAEVKRQLGYSDIKEPVQLLVDRDLVEVNVEKVAQAPGSKLLR